MKGQNNSYVKSIVKKALSGKLTTGHAAARLGISKQYLNRFKKALLEKDFLVHRNKAKSRPP